MMTAEEALRALREGNLRFVNDTAGELARDSRAIPGDPASGQQPFAVVLACSDSRVPVELVFDQGFGGLFVIRVAGNIAAPSQVGSIEYAVEQFGTRLVVVLGHSDCGAVIATLNELALGQALSSPNQRAIVDRVRPAIAPVVEIHGEPDDPAVIERSVRANIRSSVKRLSHGSRILEKLIDTGELLVIGAEYSIETGRVEFFEEPRDHE